MAIQNYTAFSTYNQMKSLPNFGKKNTDKAKNEKDKSFLKELNKSEDELIMETTPLAAAVASFFVYGVGGFALDRLILNPLLKKMKSEPWTMKQSLILNGAIGAFAAIWSGVSINNKQKKIAAQKAAEQ